MGGRAGGWADERPIVRWACGPAGAQLPNERPMCYICGIMLINRRRSTRPRHRTRRRTAILMFVEAGFYVRQVTRSMSRSCAERASGRAGGRARTRLVGTSVGRMRSVGTSKNPVRCSLETAAARLYTVGGSMSPSSNCRRCLNFSISMLII